ncbi:hypothetical protein [Streptomyces canus]|uniref:hypothetical protein n=1 Tax=Streptomyces canus TaxID=58343 RepID=UPI0036EC1723
MSDGYGADPEVLKQAAQGINQTIEELQAVGQVGRGAVGFGFESLELSPLQMGHAGLAKAFGTFAERWEWGVKALVEEGNEIAEKLDLSAGYYHEAEEYGVGVLKDVVVANYGAPTVSSQDAAQMSWSQVESGVKGAWTPDLSQESASGAVQQMGQSWQETQEDLTTSGQYGTQLRVGAEFVRESVESVTPRTVPDGRPGGAGGPGRRHQARTRRRSQRDRGRGGRQPGRGRAEVRRGKGP